MIENYKIKKIVFKSLFAIIAWRLFCIIIKNEGCEAYEDFLYNFSYEPDRNEFPYPKIGTIIDEEKSVKWNREELYRQRTAFEARVEDLNKYKNLIDVNFKEQLNRLLAKDNHITIAESKKLFDFAYDTDSVSYTHLTLPTNSRV